MSKLFLVVEDEREIAELMQFYLEEMGHLVVLRANGEEAWTYWQDRTHPPVDFILTDWKMAPLNGLQLIRLIQDSIRGISDAPRLPWFILMTGELLTAREQETLRRESGHSLLFLPKPFHRKDIQALVETLLLLQR